MSALYRIAPVAQVDLDGIWEYIAVNNPINASRFLEKFEKLFLNLARHPLMGESREELVPGLRCFPLGNYVAYYRPVENEDVAIEIIRVLHGARDIASLFGL